MMFEDALRKYIENHGIRKSWVSRVSGVGYYALVQSLNGKRELRVNEALAICKCLGIQLSDIETEHAERIEHEEVVDA